MVICLEQGAELRIPLPLTVSCFSKIEIGFTFLVLADPGSSGQRAIKRCVNWPVLSVEWHMIAFLITPCFDLKLVSILPSLSVASIPLAAVTMFVVLLLGVAGWAVIVTTTTHQGVTATRPIPATALLPPPVSYTHLTLPTKRIV